MIYKHVIYRANFTLLHCMRISLIGVLAMSVVPTVFALESSSYRLYDSIPNYGTNGTPDISVNYLLNENGMTWYAQPVVSDHYQIVTASPTVQSSSSSSSVRSLSSPSSAATHPSGGHRGNRSSAPFHPSADRSSSSSSLSRSSAALASSVAFSSSSLSSSDFAVGTPSIPCTPEMIDRKKCTAATVHPAAPCIGELCQCDRPWSFGGMCVGSLLLTWSWVGIFCAVIEVLLLLRIFLSRSTFSSPRLRSIQ